MPDQPDASRPLIGTDTSTREKSIAGIVQMWSGRLVEAQRAHRETAARLERLDKAHDKLVRQHAWALELMTEHQLEQLAAKAGVVAAEEKAEARRTQLPLVQQDSHDHPGNSGCGCH